MPHPGLEPGPSDPESSALTTGPLTPTFSYIFKEPLSEGLNVFKIKITTTLLWFKEEKKSSNFVLETLTQRV